MFSSRARSSHFFTRVADSHTYTPHVKKIYAGTTIKGHPIRGRLKSANLLRPTAAKSATGMGGAATSAAPGYMSRSQDNPYANSYYNIPPYVPAGYNPYAGYSSMTMPPRGFGVQQMRGGGRLGGRPGGAPQGRGGRSFNRTSPTDSRGGKGFRGDGRYVEICLCFGHVCVCVYGVFSTEKNGTVATTTTMRAKERIAEAVTIYRTGH